MTWAQILSSGSGKTEFAIIIEGWPYIFATHPSMEQTTADGREVICCLEREGLVIEDQCDVAHAEIESSGMTVTLVDRQKDHAVTRALAWLPDKITYLDADATRTATSMTVTAITGWSNGDVIHIGTEAAKIGASPSGSTLSSLTRGYWDTIQQAHYTADAGELTSAEITDRPTSLEGRRAYLYAWGEGDDLTDMSAGTQVWLGICSTDAALADDGCTWSVTIDPITSLMEQPLGRSKDARISTRGIYYSWKTPLWVTIGKRSGTNRFSFFSEDQTSYLVGFFETQEDFIDSLNSTLSTLNSALSVPFDNVEAELDGTGGWQVRFHLDSSGDFPIANIRSAQDGNIGPDTAPTAVHSQGYMVAGAGAYEGLVIQDTTDSEGVMVAIGNPSEWARQVPRAYYFNGHRPDIAIPSVASHITYPDNRIYLSEDPTNFTALRMKFEEGGEVVLERSSYSGTSNYYDYRHPYESGFKAAAGPATTAYAEVLYATGNLADLRDAIVNTSTGSPVLANKAEMPFITSSDMVDLSSVVDPITDGKPWAESRIYVTTDNVSFSDYFKEECKLIGVFPVLDTLGRISVAPIALPSPTSTVDGTITAADILIDDSWPTWERNAYGSINSVLIKSGYDSFEDKHLGLTLKIRDVSSFARRKVPRTVTIEPYSELRGASPEDADVPIRDAVDLAKPILGLYGSDYAVVRVQVPFKFFGLVCGDYVDFSSHVIPDLAGGRGLTNSKGLLIGRRWDLDQGRGQLTMLVSLGGIAGYTPSVYISSAAGSGTDWDLTVTSMDPTSSIDWFADGDAISDHYAAGMEIKVAQWDAASPITRTGIIDSVSDSGTSPATGTISVTFDSSWSNAGSNVVDYADAASATTAQQSYFYLADTDTHISFSTETPARKFGP